MRSVQDMCSGAVDRRAFLRQMPRRLFNSMSALMTDVFSIRSAISHDAGSEQCRRVATIDRLHCLAWEAGECQLCYLRCPLRDEAIVLDGGKPRIVVSACDGCGVCVDACRAVNDLGAIHVVNV